MTKILEYKEADCSFIAVFKDLSICQYVVGQKFSGTPKDYTEIARFANEVDLIEYLYKRITK
jgi:hypothetical protein